jgi:hypothetical protein
MMALAHEISNTTKHRYLELLKKVTIILIPVVNPDGFAAFRRYNGAGVDLNRNWANPTQPETICVSAFIKRIRPHVIVDEHEWTQVSPTMPDWIEVGGIHDTIQRRLALHLAAGSLASMPSNVIKFRTNSDQPGDDQRLAHRHFLDMGIASMLIETSPYWSVAARKPVYANLIMSMLSVIASPPDKTISRELQATMDSAKQYSLHIATHPYEPTFGDPSATYGWLVSCILGVFTMLYCSIRSSRSVQASGVQLYSGRYRNFRIPCNEPESAFRRGRRTNVRRETGIGGLHAHSDSAQDRRHVTRIAS